MNLEQGTRQPYGLNSPAADLRSVPRRQRLGDHK